MKLPTPGFLLNALFQVFSRFPGTMVCAILGTLACIALIDHGSGKDTEDMYARLWISFQLGIPLMTALVVFAESKNWSWLQVLLIQAIGFVLLAGCWYWIDPKAPDFEWHLLPQFISLLLVAHLAVSVAPFLNQQSVRDFWDYNRQLFANFIVGAAFSSILFVGLALAILATDKLFNLEIRDRVYPKLFVILSGIFNTAYFLYHFPAKYRAEEMETSAYNWVFRNLSKYILIPIVILYFLILYAYATKICLQWSLPKGWVSSLVIGFSVAGIFTYLLNFYLEEEDNSWIVKGFKRWFWWVLMPLTVLLFVAIGTRIHDYGVTEERYLVAQLGVWLAVTSLYFLFSKNGHIKFIPISLGLFALSWAVGPLSAFSVSARSQKGILTAVLSNNGRFEKGKMKPGNKALTAPEQTQLSSVIYYLNQRNGYQDLLPSPIDSSWLEPSGLLNWLKIETLGENAIHTININAFDPNEPMNIRGFDIALPADLLAAEEAAPKGPGQHFCLSKDGTKLEWWNKNALLESFSLLPMLQKWSDKETKGESNTYLELSMSERSYTFTGRQGSIQLIVERAQMAIEDSVKRLSSANGWILTKDLASKK